MGELEGIDNRTDFDLKRHSKKRLTPKEAAKSYSTADLTLL